VKPQTHRLKLTSLKFISSVDVPAQETAVARLLKRGESGVAVNGTARVAKLSDELGLVFAWAVTTKANHVDYIDLQGDNVVEEDLIKVAAEWMSAGGAADTMHDREQDGAAVFCMPMTGEVAKAFFGDKVGAELGTYGLMVAIKPSPEDYQKFKTGELTGLSIDGLGERTPYVKSVNGKTRTFAAITLKASSAVVKASLYTDEVDGHQHEIDVCDDGSMYVRYATSAGADNSHSHGIVFEGGTLTILADSGHTHVLADGQPGVAIVPADAIVVVQARAPSMTNQPRTQTGASKSTRVLGPNQTGLTSKESTMANDDKQITDLTAKNVELEKRNGALSRMSAVAFAVFKTLTGSDADAFIAKTSAEQDAQAADVAKRGEEADKVVYLSKSTGDVYKAKDDPRLIEMAKRMDAQAEAIEKADVRKQATELLKGMPGDDATHDLIVTSLRKSGAKAEEIEKAYATLKGMRETSSIGKNAAGIRGDGSIGGSPTDALAALESGLVEFGKAQSITKGLWTDGMAAFVQTEKGAALKRAYDESLRS